MRDKTINPKNKEKGKKRKKTAKIRHQTAKSCQCEEKFSKKCTFSRNMHIFEKIVFLYEKVVVILQWIWK